MNKTLRIFVYALFVLSGATSLIYQSVWVRLLSLSVGSTSASISLVLAIFFFGLALGSYVAGSLCAKVRSPIKIYGVIEGLIGLYSVGLVYIVLNLHSLLVYLPHQGEWGWVGAFAKHLLVGALLLPPTVGMGASLPLLVRVFQDSKASVGRKISLLYFINTLGAVVGAFAGSFLLIPTWGVIASNHMAAFGNLLIFAIALIADRSLRRTSDEAGSVTVESHRSSDFGLWRQLSSTQWLVLFVAFATGFSSIAAEVVWNKYLGIFFGTNIYGLGIILGIFLSGIALGSLILSWLVDRVSAKSSLFIGLLVLATLALLATSHALNYLPLAANVAAYYTGGSLNLLTIKSVLSALVVFPPTLVFGALFPLGVDLLTTSDKDAPAVVGLAYAVNTVGAICGSYLGGMVLIPYLGSSGAISVAVGMLAVASIGAILRFGRKRVASVVGAAALLAVVASSAALGNIDFRNIIKSAYVQALQASLPFSEVTKFFARDYEEFSLIREGKTAIISLSQDPKDGTSYKNYYRLKTNGLNESIYNLTNLDIVPKYEGLLGMIPYAMAKDAQNAFVVGYGGGYTVGLLTGLAIPRVHVAELESGVIDAAQYVYDGNNPILQRSNLHLTIEDARFVLATKQGGPYDIIVSQPSHSWLSGVANLFTYEFFEIVRDNLTDGGVFSQWLNLYNMDERVLRSIMRTFFEVFPHGFVFTDHSDQELIMVGSMQPITIDAQKLQALTKRPELSKALVNLPFSSAEDFVSNFASSRDVILTASKSAPLNTDVNAYAEVNQSALFYAAGDVAGKPQAYLAELYEGNLSKVVDHFDAGEKNFFYNVLSSLLKQQKFLKFSSVYESFQKIFSDSPQDLLSAGYLAMQAQRYATAKFYFAQAMKDKEHQSRAVDYMMANLVETKRWQEAVGLFKNHTKVAGPYAKCYLAEAALESGSAADLEFVTKMGQSLDTSKCGSYGDKVRGKLLQRNEEWQEAVRAFENYYAVFPRDVDVVERLTSLHLLLGNSQRGREFAGFLAQAHADRIKQLVSLADYYRQRGYHEDAYVLLSLQDD